MKQVDITTYLIELEQENPCPAAEKLANAGKSEAILPILQRYENAGEAKVDCLLDALNSLHAQDFAPEIFQRKDKYLRREALLLMEIFPSDKHFPYIETAFLDTDPKIKGQAIRCLLTANRSENWKNWLIVLIPHSDAHVRLVVAQELSLYSDETEVEAALKSQYSVELDPDVQSVLQSILKVGL